MIIKGIQKFTLIDYPGKIACTLFLFGCNFRCGFCHNPELVLFPLDRDYTEEEILLFLESRKGQLEGVCFTGGEPLLTIKKNFLQKIKEMGYLVKIDTNGSNSEKLKELIERGLVDFISIDIKSDKKSYDLVSGVNVDLEKIENSIKLIVDSGLDYEFRTTIIEETHTKEMINSLGKWIYSIRKNVKKIYLQGFKNSGKFLDKQFLKKKNTSEKYLEGLKKIIKDYFEEVEIRV